MLRYSEGPSMLRYSEDPNMLRYRATTTVSLPSVDRNPNSFFSPESDP